METIIESKSIIVWLSILTISHVIYAFFTSKDLAWVPNMSKLKTNFWYLVIWTLPLCGALLARSQLNLSKASGDGGGDDGRFENGRMYDDE